MSTGRALGNQNVDADNTRSLGRRRDHRRHRPGTRQRFAGGGVCWPRRHSDQDGANFVGAEVGSNNTAELTAIGEALALVAERRRGG